MTQLDTAENSFQYVNALACYAFLSFNDNERYFFKDWHLGNATGCRGNADELKLTQKFVVGGHFTLTLVDLNLDLGLAVGSSGEHLGGDVCLKFANLAYFERS
jgi:NAD-specific glutamate dehydrogenase